MSTLYALCKLPFNEIREEDSGFVKIRFDGMTEQITYHLPIKLWDACKFMELERYKPWDGHTSNDVLYRLRQL